MSENERIADEIIELHDLEDNADVKYASGVRVSPKDSIIEALEAKDQEIAELKETISVLHNALMDEKAKTISTANAELKAEVDEAVGLLEDIFNIDPDYHNQAEIDERYEKAETFLKKIGGEK